MFNYRTFAVATAVLLTSTFVAHAETNPTVSLSDGETLDGWTQKNGSATYEVVDGTLLGTTKEGHILVEYDGVTGFNNNPGFGYHDQPTTRFLIKGSKSPSVVPTSPIKQPFVP